MFKLFNHDFYRERLFRRFTQQDDLSGVVAFRENTGQCIVSEDQQSTDVLFNHQFQGLKDGCFGRHPPLFVTFRLQQLAYRFHFLSPVANLVTRSCYIFVSMQPGLAMPTINLVSATHHLHPLKLDTMTSTTGSKNISEL